MHLDPGRVRPREARPWWVAIAAMTAGFGLLTAAVSMRWNLLLEVDAAVARWAYDQAYGHEGFVDALRLVATAGPTTARALLLLAALALALRAAWRLTIWVVVTVAAQGPLTAAVKNLVDRPRPSWDDPLARLGTFSFPSGHAAAGGMFAATAILLTVSALPRGRVRTLLCGVWVLVGLALGLDRIFLGVHYLSDVVAGWLLGAAVALLVWQLVVRMGAVAPAASPGADGTRPSRFAVIANPVHIADMAAFRSSVTAAGAQLGWTEPLWFETRVDDPGVGMSEQAVAAGVQMVLAAGGDGTVRIICSKLAGTGVAVGVVPLGTGNLLARNLGLPLHRGDAVETALAGQNRAVDVVRVTGDDMAETCFTVMGGLGLDAAIMAGAPDQLKARMGWPAYVVSALRQIQHPATWVEVTVDGQAPVRRKVRTVVIGNVGSLQAGIPLLPDALIDDGRLDVVVIAPSHTVGWLRLVVRVLRRTRRTDEHLDRMTGQRVSIRADKPLLRQLDGDPVGAGLELHAEVLPGSLLVRVPQAVARA